MAELTSEEIRILKLLQSDLPVAGDVFDQIAASAGVTTEKVLETVSGWLENGIIRRFGGVVRHMEVGLRANGMSIWCVPEKRVDEVGVLIAGFDEVSHCYRRDTPPDWRHNVFAMIHGKTQQEVEQTAQRISQSTGIDDYEILYTTKEFKKTSMKYFSEDDEL